MSDNVRDLTLVETKYRCLSDSTQVVSWQGMGIVVPPSVHVERVRTRMRAEGERDRTWRIVESVLADSCGCPVLSPNLCWGGQLPSLMPSMACLLLVEGWPSRHVLLVRLYAV